MSTSLRLSLGLQRVAEELNTLLKEVSGEELAFVLVVSADNTAQYVSNASRKDGVELIQSLQDRWKAKRADIPAHYNPDLKARKP